VWRKFTNLAIILATIGLEKIWLLKNELSKIITYEKIDLIKPEKYEELLADLQERTGIKNIKRVEIGKIDFLRDTCILTIYFESNGKNQHTINRPKDDMDDDD
jgi:hypothetical protein